MDEGFKVRDSRLFNADGSPKNSEKTDSPTSQPVKSQEQKTTTQQESPEIDFNTFVLSLASSVQISLGVIAHPMTQKIEIDLQSAKQTIDILGLIERKTEGNLEPDESGLLKNILYQLRMQYVESSKKQNPV